MTFGTGDHAAYGHTPLLPGILTPLLPGILIRGWGGPRCSPIPFTFAPALGMLLGAISVLLGYTAGFDIFPIGEDHNWIDCYNGGLAAAARLMWALDNRNPLSPWWYIAARKIILNYHIGLFGLRYAIGLLHALSAYCMVITVAGGQSRAFALGLSILTDGLDF
jgi:hypothetical protein